MNAVLELSGLTATYGEGLVLHGIDLTAKKGRVTCLVGRNGVGKSTTLRAIMGLIKTPSGSIKLDGEDITRLSTDARAHRGIGYVPQGREIFPQITVEENLLLGLEANKAVKSIDPEIFTLFPILKEFLPRKGGDLVKDFTFANDGTVPLVITRVVTSCSCLRASFPKRPVPPGGEAAVRIVYEPHKSDPGVFHKVIQIYSNSVDGRHVITVQGCSVDRKER